MDTSVVNFIATEEVSCKVGFSLLSCGIENINGIKVQLVTLIG
jgi:hypothetical protein